MPAVGVRVRADPATCRPERGRFSSGMNRPCASNSSCGLVAAHPVFELLEAGWVFLDVCHRHLMGPPASFELVAADLSGLLQPLGVRSTIIGQRGRNGLAARSGLLLGRADLGNALVERGGHRLVHGFRIGALDEVRRPAGAAEERFDLVVADASPDRRVVDLVAVQVQDRQNGTVADRVEELVDVPAGRERPGLRFAVADDRGDNQVGVVERRPAGVGQDVTEFAALMDRAGRLRACSGCRSRRGRKTA